MLGLYVTLYFLFFSYLFLVVNCSTHLKILHYPRNHLSMYKYSNQIILRVFRQFYSVLLFDGQYYRY